MGILRVFIVHGTHSTHEVRFKNITTGYEPKPQLGFIYSAVDLRVRVGLLTLSQCGVKFLGQITKL